MEVTPVKVYSTKPANATCTFCHVEHSSSSSTLNIYGRLSNPGGFFDQITTVIGYKNAKDTIYSSTACRACHNIIARFYKHLNHIEEFTRKFAENEDNVIPAFTYKKRCSVSPHTSGVIQKKACHKPDKLKATGISALRQVVGCKAVAILS